MRPGGLENVLGFKREMDEYKALDDWKQMLRQTSVAYCNADNSIKAMNAELKPLRQTVKECGMQVIGLLAERNERRCDLLDQKVSLNVVTKDHKKMPSKAQIRDRCLQFTGDEEKGEELFKFLMAPETQSRTKLTKRRLGKQALKQPAPQKSFVSEVNDMIEDLEAEDHASFGSEPEELE